MLKLWMILFDRDLCFFYEDFVFFAERGNLCHFKAVYNVFMAYNMLFLWLNSCSYGVTLMIFKESPFLQSNLFLIKLRLQHTAYLCYKFIFNTGNRKKGERANRLLVMATAVIWPLVQEESLYMFSMLLGSDGLFALEILSYKECFVIFFISQSVAVFYPWLTSFSMKNLVFSRGKCIMRIPLSYFKKIEASMPDTRVSIVEIQSLSIRGHAPKSFNYNSFFISWSARLIGCVWSIFFILCLLVSLIGSQKNVAFFARFDIKPRQKFINPRNEHLYSMFQDDTCFFVC